MTKRNVEPIESGAGIFADFVTKLIAEIRKRGGNGAELQQAIKARGEETLGKMADFLVGIKQTAANIFTVTVDYSRSLAEMIAAGKYDWVNSDITQKHSPLSSIPAGLPTKAELQPELVHFNRCISSDNAIAELKRLGMRPATLPELLAFGEKYPEEQRKYPIVALGSVWQHWRGRNVPYLWDGADDRLLDLGWFEFDWDGDYRFLAVRES